jgi:predicted phosphodiesterase
MVTNPLAIPTRIAFAGDWHENAPWAAKAIKYAKDQGADVILHLGDFGYSYSRRFLRDVGAAALFQQLPVLFVDGNHENFDRLNNYPVGDDGLRQITDNVWHLPRGFRWQWNELRFLALGGAHSVDRPYRTPGVSWWPEEVLTEEQVNHAISGGPADVLIAHDCPAGVRIPGIDDRVGPPPFSPMEILRSDEHRQLLRRVVDAVRPSWVWHGHYHVAYDTVADLDYGDVRVTGLNCDETAIGQNVAVINLADLASGLPL